MPKYRFICSACKAEREKYVSVVTETLPCPYCEGQQMHRQMPTISGQEVRETIDPFMNHKWKQDQKEILEKRKDDYYWEVEVPRFVQTYSVETCLAEGWLVYNEKGELVINKPTSKR
jgi:hypothetical protein